MGPPLEYSEHLLNPNYGVSFFTKRFESIHDTINNGLKKYYQFHNIFSQEDIILFQQDIRYKDFGFSVHMFIGLSDEECGIETELYTGSLEYIV